MSSLSEDHPAVIPTPSRSVPDRLRTADFIAEMDILTILVVFITAYLKTPSAAALVEFPWWTVMLGVAMLFVRMTLLLALNGSWRKLLAGVLVAVNGVVNYTFGSVTDTDEPPWEVVQRLKTKTGGPLRRAHFTWYCLLSLGILALILIIGGSGGVSGSPFWEIFVATFILGQFRAPTIRGIWALFGFGLLSASAAQALYLGLHHADPRPFDTIHFGVASYIAPGLLVGFISTLVYWLTRRRESQLDTRRGT